MEIELVLADVVRNWAEMQAPGDEATIRDAVERALVCYASGASLAEACEAARCRVLSRLGHPSHSAARRMMEVPG